MTRFLSDRTDATDSFFRAFKADTGVAAEDYLVVALGHDEMTSDEGLQLVRLGITRATAAPASDFGEAVPLPKVGDHAILLDGRDNPRCVWQTTEVVTKPFASVDDATGWLSEHPGAEVVSVAEAYRIGNELTTSLLDRLQDDTPVADAKSGGRTNSWRYTHTSGAARYSSAG